MFVLGVNVGYHDSSAALLDGGGLSVMVEQERVSRRKRAICESPAGAIRACLDSARVDLADLSALAVGWDVPRLAVVEGVDFDEAKFLAWLLPEALFGPGARMRLPARHYYPHHLAHAASAMWTSGLPDAAILVMDGRGEEQSTSILHGTEAGLAMQSTWDTDFSLGNYYGFATEWAGMSYADAGKLMGLAAYGQPSEQVPLRPTGAGYEIAGFHGRARRISDQFFELRDHVRREFDARCYPFRAGSGQEPMAYAGFAASVQRSLEEVVWELSTSARQDLGTDRLAIAGGVGLNCTLNGRLIASGAFSQLHVPPFPHDVGVSVGAALLAARALGQGPTPARLEHAYWGPEPECPEELVAAVRRAGLRAVRLDDEQLVDAVAGRLADGALVGWWQGRAEVGPRALGARSILCDPRDRHNVFRVNSVKGREMWRPLAPSVLAGHAAPFFGGPLPAAADFMLAACTVDSAARQLVPAVVHVDGSARPQAVRKETNPRFWRLIDAFRQLTGVPMVLNTSFNLAGEPIVFTAADAVDTFRRSELDALALGDFLIEKQGARSHGPSPDAPAGFNLMPWEERSWVTPG